MKSELETKHNPLFLDIEQHTVEIKSGDLALIKGQAKAWETVFDHCCKTIPDFSRITGGLTGLQSVLTVISLQQLNTVYLQEKLEILEKAQWEF